MSTGLAVCLGLTLLGAPAIASGPAPAGGGSTPSAPSNAGVATTTPAAGDTTSTSQVTGAAVGTTPSTPPWRRAPVEPAPEVVTEGPLTGPALEQWARKRRKLQIQTGVAGGLSGVFLVTGLLLLFAPATCRDPDPDFGCGEGYGRYSTAFVMFPGALVAAIPMFVYGVRLHQHNRTNPAWVRLQPAPGGLTLRF